MKIDFWINDKRRSEEIPDDMTLLDFFRKHHLSSIKCGCETTNCGICTVIVEDKPVLACATLAIRVREKHVYTLEGCQSEAEILGAFLASEGADQCGFCNPGLMMTMIAMKKELSNPSDEEIKAYLSGNLCRCTGYEAQLRGVKSYLEKGLEGRPQK
jgi:carbon-monoxide dehydrogenase small subunit